MAVTEWQGGTIGELVTALCALETEAEGAQFMASYTDWLTTATTDDTRGGMTPEALASMNVGYAARYCDDATYERICRLTGAVHPVFGAVSG